MNKFYLIRLYKIKYIWVSYSMYSLELILHVVYYYKTSNIGLRTIAKNLCLSKSTICRWVNKYGDKVNGNDINKEVDTTKTSTPTYNENTQLILRYLKNSLNQNPFQTLKMMEENIKRKLNICVSIKTISNYLKIIGYRRKKVVKRYHTKNLKDHIKDRKMFMKKIKNINHDDILCIDETYVNEKIYAEYGYTSNKRLIKYYKINKNNAKKSIIMCISNKKIIKYEIHKKKGINTEIYSKFMSELVADIKDKYILMDNVSFHKSKKVIDIIEKSGNKALFIPPYSPDCNPIEEVFSSMKAYLRKYINPLNIDKKLSELIIKWSRNIDNLNSYYINSFT